MSETLTGKNSVSKPSTESFDKIKNSVDGILSDPKSLITLIGLGATTITGIYAAAKWLFDKNKEVKGLLNTNQSLTRLTKQLMIQSRVYVDGPLEKDMITTRVIQAAQTLYVGMIFQAIQLGNLVTSSRTVSDFLGPLKTQGMENFKDSIQMIDEIKNNINEKKGPSDFDKILERRQKIEKFQWEKQREEDRKRKAAEEEAERLRKKNAPDQASIKDVDIKPTDLLPTGKLIEVTLSNPHDKESSQVITLLVQMIPFVMNSKASKLLLTHAVPQSFHQRWLLWKAGEISFWKDFIFQVDQIKKMEEAVKSDKSNQLAEYIKDVSNRNSSSLMNVLFESAEHMKSSNFANSVMIFTEETMKAAKAETGFDITKEASRKKFFESSYSLMVFVVDQSFNSVTLYINGIDNVGHYTYDQFVSSRGKKDVDIVDLLSSLSQGRSPRF